MRKNADTSQRRAHERLDRVRKMARRLRKRDWQRRFEPRLYRDRHLGFDGRAGGPLVPGVPRVSDLPLRAYWDDASLIVDATEGEPRYGD